ncbi:MULTISPECIES: sulfite exporter TauE/SafE family protein [Streptomyces]|uniref:sulfite exporter TauE/SafE family protein n=1 Tax=Streptomyces TaxID=1883 RepID=UPI00211D2C1A|nr:MULTISPECIES: sulfite exporter TauE/SafE family protein [Streptomyces]
MTSAWIAALLLGGVVLVGSSVQRMSGIGFGLVSVPALVLLLGPGEGVTLANCAAGVISAVGLASHWRQVRLRAMVPLVCASACTVPLGALIAGLLPEPVLLTGMGALVSVAVLLVMRGARVASLRGTGGAVAAGAASGFMNSSAGVGGPALSLYAVNAEWTARQFTSNALFYGLVVNVFSVAAKGVPQLTAPSWLLTAAGIAGGAVAGRALAARISERRARLVVLLLALGGGVTTMAKGLVGL